MCTYILMYEFVCILCEWMSEWVSEYLALWNFAVNNYETIMKALRALCANGGLTLKQKSVKGGQATLLIINLL